MKKFSQKTLLYDDTILEYSMDNTIEIVTSDYSDFSERNASNKSVIEIYNISEDIVYNMPVKKMAEGRGETPDTVFTVNAINTLHIQRLIKVLLDSGSRKTSIGRSVFPMNTVPKSYKKVKRLEHLQAMLRHVTLSL